MVFILKSLCGCRVHLYVDRKISITQKVYEIFLIIIPTMEVDIMNKFKLLLIYAIAASFLSVVGGYNFSLLTLVIGTLILLASIYFSESLGNSFSKTKREYLPILFVILLCVFNGSLYFLTDSKDFNALIIIQGLWGILGIGFYLVRKFMLTSDNNFFREILQWYLGLFILILAERIINRMKFLDLNFDLIHFIIAIFVWKVISTFLIRRKTLGKEI